MKENTAGKWAFVSQNFCAEQLVFLNNMSPVSSC